MKSNHSANTLIRSNPSYTVLAETPGRALKFLHTAAVAPQIFAVLCAAGYTKGAHDAGWALLHAVTGYRSAESATPASGGNEAADALAEIEHGIGPLFKRAQAALRHMYPVQEAFVFQGLRVGRGAESMIAMTIYLDRCDELRDGKSRAATRREDHAALATLEERGVGAAERKRFRELTVIARTGVRREPLQTDDTDRDRAANLVALHAWVQDWSETARAVIKNRAWLIRLGAAKRRTRNRPPPPPTAPAKSRETVGSSARRLSAVPDGSFSTTTSRAIRSRSESACASEVASAQSLDGGPSK